jgi:hypothetical protein
MHVLLKRDKNEGEESGMEIAECRLMNAEHLPSSSPL